MSRPSSRASRLPDDFTEDSIRERPRTPLAIRPPIHNHLIVPLLSRSSSSNIDIRPGTYRKIPAVSDEDIPHVLRYSASDVAEDDEEHSELPPFRTSRASLKSFPPRNYDDVECSTRPTEVVSRSHRSSRGCSERALKQELGVKDNGMQELAQNIQASADGILKVTGSVAAMAGTTAFDMPLIVSELVRMITELEEEEKMLDHDICQEECSKKRRNEQMCRLKQSLQSEVCYIEKQIKIVQTTMGDRYEFEQKCNLLETGN